MEVTGAHFNVHKIPIEMWNQIFLCNITKNELLNLSLVSKGFYQVIGSSPDAMNTIMLEIDGEKSSVDIKTILSSSRSYRNMTIRNFNDFESISKVFAKFGQNLKYLKIVNCKFSVREMLKIFKTTSQNLKTLHLEKLPKKPLIRDTKAFKKFSFKFLQLENLLFLNCDFFSLLKCFSNTLKSFSFYCFTKDDDQERDIYERSQLLVKFLAKQNNLKELKLYTLMGTAFDHNLILNAFDVKMKFKLESLEVTMIHLVTRLYHNENFEEFLQSQRRYLKKLKLYYYETDPHNFDGDFPVLEKFIFCRSCRISENCYSDYYKVFPNLLETVVGIDYVTRDFLAGHQNFFKTFINNYQKLKKLTFKVFQDFWFRDVSFENIEELTITCLEGNQLKVEHMFTAFQNLKVLKIKKWTPINSKLFAWILLNFKNLERLIIEEGSQLKIMYLINMLQLYQNLEYLEILNIQEPIDQFKQILSNQFPKLKYRLSQQEAASIENGDDEEDQKRFSFQNVYDYKDGIWLD